LTLASIILFPESYAKACCLAEIPSKIRQMKYIFLSLGWINFVLGVLGFFLPVLPSVPFMILAAYFFSKGSERLHLWLLHNRYFGPTIRDWETHKKLPKKVKLTLSLSIILLFLYPMFFFTIAAIYQILMAIMALTALYYLWKIPSAN
jgi:uncharacterized membrane protein YbaN (DUF454 family)